MLENLSFGEISLGYYQGKLKELRPAI